MEWSPFPVKKRYDILLLNSNMWRAKCKKITPHLKEKQLLIFEKKYMQFVLCANWRNSKQRYEG